MDNPGIYTLAALGIGLATPVAGSRQAAIVDLDGMSEVSFEATFAYGSGGTSLIAVVQTTFDDGVNWRDIARFEFATAAATKTACVTKIAAGVVGYAALNGEFTRNGCLGNQLSVLLFSTGTYVDSAFALRASVS